MPQSRVSVDVHGSCVSMSILQEREDFLAVGHNFSRNHLVSCMMPPVDLSIRQEELIFKSDYSYRCIKRALDKSTLPLLEASDADFLLLDFYDFCQPVASYQNTTFSTYDYSVLLAPSLKPHLGEIGQVNFLELPSYLWYGYVDLYFERVKARFGDRIILVRLCCCDRFLSKSGAILPTPTGLLRYGNAAYNGGLRALEDYVIARYDPYVIDVSRYFIGDEAFNPDVTPVHFAKNYQISAWQILRAIVQNQPKEKYYDRLPTDVVADLLQLPVSAEDFRGLLADIPRPKSTCPTLDAACLHVPDEAILQNRFRLGDEYRRCQGPPIGGG